jgi:putative CocE/NonD family hydrolase
MFTYNAWIGRTARCAGLVLAALGFAVFASGACARPPDGPCEVQKQLNVAARMRDGVTLYADVYRPKGDGTYPVILQRLPYNKDAAQTYVYAPPQFYASHCYIVVIQDVRGQYTSEGTFYAFRDEAKDGYDTIEWAARLPGANGKVGMYGFSYVGATQWMPATLRPPSLVTIVPAMTSSDYYDGWSYEGGAFSLAFKESWPLVTIALTGSRRLGDQGVIDRMNEAVGKLWETYKYLPIKDYPWLFPDRPEVAPYFYDWIEHNTWDDYWKQWSIRTRYDQVQVPALNFSGWYDVFMNGAIENFVGMRAKGGNEVARKGQKLVVGPWIHLPWVQKVGEVDFGPEAVNPVDELQLNWFDHWLKGKSNAVAADPPVRVFVMGANQWRAAQDWPIPGTQFTEYYLHSRGAANTRYGNGWLSTEKPTPDEAPDRYRYDPANPVPSKGGHSCCTSDTAPVGPFDQAPIQERADVLVYTTPPLEQPVEVTGPITVTLYAASSARDTDFTAKLTDVHPDGKAILLNNGIIRASFRESLENPTPIEPGKVYEYRIAIWPTSNLFKAGHRIRLEISSSNFPHYDRNPNTGRRSGLDAELAVADQTIYHDPQRPSKVVLPIMAQPIAP